MANYIVSAPDTNRQIKTNGSGLTKSIKTLLDEGYDSVTVMPEIEDLDRIRPKFKIGQQVKVIANGCSHQFSIGDTVIIDSIMAKKTIVGYSYRCSGYVNGKPDMWWAFESDLAEI